MSALETYLREMEENNLLLLLFNGWRNVNDQPTLETVTLEYALSDEGFCKFIENNSKDEINKGI